MNDEQKNQLSVFVKYKSKLIKIAIVVVIVIIVVAAIFFKGYSSASDKYEEIVKELKGEIEELSDQTAIYTVATKEVLLNLIESKISDIGELATIEYSYTDAGKFEDPKQLFGMDIPFTTKSFIAKWDGVIKAGVKIDEITVDVNDITKEIIIHMPKAEILSHEIDNDSIETLDEKDGLFNLIKVEDVREFDVVSKNAMEKRVIENGILDKAIENAKKIIEKLVNNDVVKEQGYIIQFEVIE